jgi:hypothetical protein
MATANDTAPAMPERFLSFMTDHDCGYFPSPTPHELPAVLLIDTSAPPVLLAATLQARLETLRGLVNLAGYVNDQVTPAEIAACLEPAVQESVQLIGVLLGQLRDSERAMRAEGVRSEA